MTEKTKDIISHHKSDKRLTGDFKKEKTPRNLGNTECTEAGLPRKNTGSRTMKTCSTEKNQ